MIKARIRWCSCSVENILTLGKLLRLWFCFLLHSILFFISQTSYRTYKITSAMSSLAHNGNHFSSLFSFSFNKKKRRKKKVSNKMNEWKKKEMGEKRLEISWRERTE